jgi:hypothetical protein
MFQRRRYQNVFARVQLNRVDNLRLKQKLVLDDKLEVPRFGGRVGLGIMPHWRFRSRAG